MMEDHEKTPLYEKARIEKKLESVVFFYEEIVRKMKNAYDDLNHVMLYVKTQMELMQTEKNEPIVDKEINHSFEKETRNQKETLEHLNILNSALEKQKEVDYQNLDELKVINLYEEKEDTNVKFRKFLNTVTNNFYTNVCNEETEMVLANVIDEINKPVSLESNHLGSTRIEDEVFEIKKKSKKPEGTYEEISDCTLTISDDENHKGNLHWEKRTINHASTFQNKKNENDTNENEEQHSYMEQFNSPHYGNDPRTLSKNVIKEKTYHTHKGETLQTKDETKHKENMFLSKTKKDNHLNDFKQKNENPKISYVRKENQDLTKKKPLFPFHIDDITCFKKIEEPASSYNEYKNCELKGKIQMNYETPNQSPTCNIEQNEAKENNAFVSNSILNLTTNDSNKAKMYELFNNKMYMEMIKQNIGNASMNHYFPMNPMSPFYDIYLNNYIMQREMMIYTLQTISLLNMQNPNYLKTINENHLHILAFLNTLSQQDDVCHEEGNDKTTHRKRKLKNVYTNFREKESKTNQSNPFTQNPTEPTNHFEEFSKKIKTYFSNQIKEEVNKYLEHVMNIKKKKKKAKSNIYKKGIKTKEIKYRKPKKTYMNNHVSSSFISYVESFTSTGKECSMDLKKQYMENPKHTGKQNPVNNLCKTINCKTLKRNRLESNYFKQGMNPQKIPYFNKEYMEIPNEKISKHGEIKKRKRSCDKNKEKKKERKIKEMKKQESTEYFQEYEIGTVGSHMENTDILSEPFFYEESSTNKPREKVIKVISTEESEYRFINNSCKEDLFITTSDASYSKKNKYDLKQLITRSRTQRNVVNTVKRKNIHKDNKARNKNPRKEKEKKPITKKRNPKQTKNKAQTDGTEKMEAQKNSNEFNCIMNDGFENSQLHKSSSDSISHNSAFSSINNSNTTKDYFISLNEKDNHYFFEDIYPTKYELRSRKQVTYAIPSRKKKLRRYESKPLFDPFAYNNSWKIQI